MTDTLVKEGIKACQSDDFEKGVELFDQALAKDPKNIEAIYNRARALSKLSKLKEALIDFELLVSLQPANATFIGDYAVALHLNEKNDEAKIQFDQALKLEPKNPYRWSSRAFFRDRTGNSKEAITDYEKAIELDPKDAIALNNKGLIEEKLGYMERSKSSFDRSNKIVGYKPKTGTPNEQIRSTSKTTTKEAEKLTCWKVVKSVFTKDGFNDFMHFTKNKLFGAKK